jgi:hypothetical protein
MPFPTRKPRLQRALMKKLLAPWRDETELREATVGVASRYEEDGAPMRRPWVVAPRPLPPDPPTAFIVVRLGEHDVVEDSEVYRGDTQVKAKAIADALEALEKEAERGVTYDDA